VIRRLRPKIVIRAGARRASFPIIGCFAAQAGTRTRASVAAASPMIAPERAEAIGPLKILHCLALPGRNFVASDVRRRRVGRVRGQDGGDPLLRIPVLRRDSGAGPTVYPNGRNAPRMSSGTTAAGINGTTHPPPVWRAVSHHRKDDGPSDDVAVARKSRPFERHRRKSPTARTSRSTSCLASPAVRSPEPEHSERGCCFIIVHQGERACGSKRDPSRHRWGY